jgi:hypothetical protein
MTANKPGRNDPCPCGSGKKFKRCCGRDSSALPDFLLPDDQRSGTPFDDYSELLPLIALYEHKIVQFEAEGPELKKARKNYEKRYRPGEKGGLLDSHFLSWLYFDLRFGGSRKTIIERVLDDPMTAKLVEPGPTCLRHMAGSYATFYEVIDESPEVVLLEELGTGRLWRVFFFRELFDTPPGKGEIWYTRLIGLPERALCYTTPYVYEPESRAQFKRGVNGLVEDFHKSELSIGVPPDRLFAESQKDSALFWAEYIHVSENAPREMLSSVPSEWPAALSRLPHIINTDKEDILLTETYFRVKDEAAVRKRLAKLKTFPYDERDDSWSWLKAPSRTFPDEPRTSLGRFRFKDGFLVAETNSRERAVRLEFKLNYHLPGLLVLDRTLYKRLEDLPPPTAEEIEARRNESEDLNSRPEVQEAMRQHLERHYFEKLPRMKVPALGNITPIQAAKTEAGRRKLAELVDYYDRMQDLDKSGRPKVDFDRLRRMFGLPPRSH